MYNSYKEIIWLLNLMNMNDKKATISVNDIFDKNGNFLKDKKTGEEIGIKLLKRKANGYISYVRGENPYSFPYRIWPYQFDNDKSINNIEYPNTQLNNKIIKDPIKHLSIYVNKIGNYQEKAYNYIIKNIQEQKDNNSKIDFENLDTFGYNILQKLIECLIIAYQNDKLENMMGGASDDEKVDQPDKKEVDKEQKESTEEPLVSEVDQPNEEQKESIEEPLQSEELSDQEQEVDQSDEKVDEEQKESLEEPVEPEALPEQEEILEQKELIEEPVESGVT